MIVDSHCHAWTTWPYDTNVPDPQHRGTIGRLLFEMYKEGVDKAVLICSRMRQKTIMFLMLWPPPV